MFSIPNLQPSGTVRFTFTGIRFDGAPGDLELEMRHAGKGNPGWEKAKRKVEAAMKARTGAIETEALTLELIAPFAQFVIVGWNNAFEDGKAVTYTPTRGEEMLRGIVEKGGYDYVSDGMGYALTRANFRDLASPAEVLGKE